MGDQPKIQAYTDGACSGNPGPGGWGVLLYVMNDGTRGDVEELNGGAPQTTNNRMELMAAISALEHPEQPSEITLITDSRYVRDGMMSWVDGWKKNNWKTSNRKPVKNVELWQRLDTAQNRHDVTWKWVKGHAGNPDNERADKLARMGMAPYQSGLTHSGLEPDL